LFLPFNTAFSVLDSVREKITYFESRFESENLPVFNRELFYSTLPFALSFVKF